MDELRETVEKVAGRIARYGPKGINEQDTKATLIQPVLRALGWDVEDLEDVQREYKRRKNDKPVDYALLLLRTPKLFVEAKALGENLDDRKWANQIMGYASVAGVEWVVLTDGNEYRLYNSHATVPIEEKLFRTVRLSDDADAFVETAALLSKERIQDNQIDVLWKAHFVDRQVRTAVEGMFDGDPDPSLVRLVTKRVANLTASEVKASLRRAQAKFDFPIETTSDEPTRSEPPRRATKKPKSAPTQPKRGIRKGIVYPNDLIAAGLLKPPVRIFKHYKGRDLEATIRADGKIVFENEVCDTPSTAAEFARASVTGRRMQTNGWTFWQCKDGNGEIVELDNVRISYKQREGL